MTHSNYRILVLGNPNCGKSTLFNKLTGANQKTGNFPGVTVEKHSGKLRNENQEIELIDLPGSFSLTGNSEEKKVLTRILMQREATDKVLFIMDSTLLERSLQFFFQIADLGAPILLVLTMKDILEKRNISISLKDLEHELGVKCFLINAKSGEGVEELKKYLFQEDSFKISPRKWKWEKEKEEFFREISNSFEFHENEKIFLDFLILNTLKKLSGEVLQEELPTLEILGNKFFQHVQKKFNQRNLKFTYEEELIQKSIYIKQILSRVVFGSSSIRFSKWEQKIDKYLLHPTWGLLIFLIIMGIVFQALFRWAEIPMNLIEDGFTFLGNWLGNFLPEGPLRKLIIEGVIMGVGSVMVFVPQIGFLFFFIGLLEESGYIARASFVMDKFMGRFGLSGKSFIPLLSSAACAVPSILGARAIEDKSDRMRTILVSPLITCSARYPVYILVIGTIFSEKLIFGIIDVRSLVLFCLFFLGMFTAFVFALIFKKTFFKKDSSYFILELPSYKIPSVKNVSYNVYLKLKDFVLNTGQIILFASILLWFLANYPYNPEVQNKQENIQFSYAAKIGKTIEPIIEPLGFDWKIGVAILTSFAAREVMVSTLAIIYGVEGDEPSSDLQEAMKNDINPKTQKPVWSFLTGLSVLIFYAYACQCISTLAVVRKETNSYFWPLFLFSYMTILAYLSSLFIYQVGRLFL